MAFATNEVDIYRGTQGLSLPPELSAEILEKTTHESAIMRLAERVTMPGSGISMNVITGDPVADWTVESTEKPVSTSTFETKTMTPYKIAVIELFSNEFRRDLPSLYDALVRRLPYAISKKFDETIFHGTAPGTGFDVLSGIAAVDIATNTYQQLVGVKTNIAQADYQLNGWAISPAMDGLLLSTVDGQLRPLFINSVTNDDNVSRLLGAATFETPHVYKAGTPDVIGFAGDWRQARYGIVDGINVEISTQATINDGTNQINLWQRNMFAVRAEAELAFIYTDADAFVKLTATEADSE